MSLNILNQQLVGNGSNTHFTLIQSVANTSSVLAIVNGLVQIPEVDYTITGTQLTFTTAPYNNSDIEIRYYSSTGEVGYTGSAGSQGSVGGYTGSQGALGAPSNIQLITATGSTYYTLVSTPSSSKSILVVVNGLIQVPEADYTVSGSTINFNTIPVSTSDIEIIYFGNDVGYRGSEGFRGSAGFTGSVGTSGQDGYTGSSGYTGSAGIGYGGSIGFTGSGGWAAPSSFQVFVANGSSTYDLTKTVGSPKDILVSVNGLLQIPDTDYFLSGSSIVFNTIPESTSDVEILYFDVAGYIGSQGYQGSIGFKGSAGDSGGVGYSGSRGFVGSAGIGSTGYTGSGGVVAPADLSLIHI